jgi:hypothetical protein
MIWRVRSSKGEFSNKPSFPVNLSINRSGLMMREVNPSTLPRMVSFKDGFTQSHKQQIVIALVGDVGDVGFYVYRGLEDCSDFLLHQTGFL